MQNKVIVFCPQEDYRLERCLAWLEAELGSTHVFLLALPARMELASSIQENFPGLRVEVIAYPDCGMDEYYSPEHLSVELAAKFNNTRNVKGVVLLSGPPPKIRYMQEYITPSVKKDYNYFRILNKLGVRDIWTHDAAGIRKHNMMCFADDFVDIHKGKRAWVIGNGPSLKNLDMSLLKDEITFGSNRIYLGFDDWGFSTTYWGTLDSLQCEKHMREWEKNIPDETVKFYPFEYLNLFQLKNACPVNFYPPGHPECRTNFIDPLHMAELEKANNFSSKPDVIYLGHTVLYGLLQMAAIMGCDPIYLIGVDHNYSITAADKKRGLWSNEKSANHFHEGYGKSSGAAHDFHLPEMERIENAFNYAQKWASENGVTIENATPGSKLRSFPMIDFSDALKKGVKACLKPRKTKAQENQDSQSSITVSDEPVAADVSKQITATILVCTPNLYSEHARKCITSIHEHTKGIPYELLIFENGNFGRFQHPHEINRALEIAQGDVVVTLDDDVILTEGWLDSLIALASEDVGIVGNIHLHANKRDYGKVRHAGGWIDLDGAPRHCDSVQEKPIAVPYVCSACMLINDKSLRFCLEYKKFFQEAEFCIESWKKGKKVIVSPHKIYHYGHGQMEVMGMTRDQILEQSAEDRATFCSRWVKTGELKRIYDQIRNDVDIPLPQ